MEDSKPDSKMDYEIFSGPCGPRPPCAKATITSNLIKAYRRMAYAARRGQRITVSDVAQVAYHLKYAKDDHDWKYQYDSNQYDSKQYDWNQYDSNQYDSNQYDWKQHYDWKQQYDSDKHDGIKPHQRHRDQEHDGGLLSARAAPFWPARPPGKWDHVTIFLDELIVEAPQAEYVEQIVHVPRIANHEVEWFVEAPQVEYVDKIVRARKAETHEKVAEAPQAEYVEKIVHARKSETHENDVSPPLRLPQLIPGVPRHPAKVDALAGWPPAER